MELPTVDNTTSDSSRTLSIQLQSSPQYDVSVEVATAQLVDNEVSVPIPLVTIAPASFSEGDIGDNTEGSVVVTLDRSTTVQVNVNYSFRSGTAILGNDFSATSGTLNFAPSVRQLTIPFTVIGDVTVEPDESFYVDLTIPDSKAAFAGAVNTIAGTVEILNDDPNIGINKTGSGSISGTARNDTLTGSSAIDTILAGAGNDRLEGKGEADILIGGLGADSFVYNNFSDSTLSAFDSINDFNPDPSEGDRIGVASLPSKLWSSGVISASTLADAMAGAFANPDGDSNTSDVLAQGDAVIFSYNPLPWLTFNYLAVKGGSGDLVVSLEGYNPGTAGSLVVSNFFTSSSTP